MAIKAADQLTILDVSDAYSIMLTSETYTFIGGTSGAETGVSCETEAVAFCGSNQCSTVNVTAADIVTPTGISASVTNNGTAKVKIKFTTTATITTACEASIPVVVDGVTINKKFSFAVAKAGTNGTNGKDGTSVTVKSSSVTYQVGDSGTTKPTGTWSTNIPTVADGKFLWTKTVVTYSDNKSTESYSVSYKAKNGAAGADAITVTITTSNGTIFKNNSGSTVLTAHVWKGSIEQTVADNGTVSGLGTIKWYKTGTSTAVATAKTLTVSANDVTNSQAYTCQLEG